MGSERYTTALLFLLLSAVWGLSFVAARAAVVDIPPLWLAALRFDVAGVLLLASVALTTERWRPTARTEWSAVVVGGTLFVAVHHALLFAGQQCVTSAVAGVVISLDPVLAAAFARLLLPEERLSPVGDLGMLLGLCGVAVVAILVDKTVDRIVPPRPGEYLSGLLSTSITRTPPHSPRRRRSAPSCCT